MKSHLIMAFLTDLKDFPFPPFDMTDWPWKEADTQFQHTLSDGSPLPRISVVTPSFNQGQFLEETIRSVLLQDYPNLEYIIMDGGSTDSSVEIIRKYEPWLTYWISEPDKGQSHAINKGWSLATGDLISYINSDDLYLPGAFKEIAQAYVTAGKPGFIIGNTVTTDSGLKQIGLIKPFLPMQSKVDLTLLGPGLWSLPQQSAFWSKEMLDQVGELREELHYTMDRELWYRICKLTTGMIVDTNIAISRSHSDAKAVAGMLNLYKEDALALSYHNDGNTIRNLQRKLVAKKYLSWGYMRKASLNAQNNRKKAIIYFFFSLAYNPNRLFKRDTYGFLLKTLRLI